MYEYESKGAMKLSDNNDTRGFDAKPAGSVNEGSSPEADAADIDNEKTKRIDLSEISGLRAAAPSDSGEEPEAASEDESAAEKDLGAEPESEDEAPRRHAPDSGEGYTAVDGTDAQLLSEFAPKPMSIPNVDLEKEKKKQDKRRKNRGKEVKKVQARKNKNGRKKSLGRRVLVVVAGFLLFALLSCALAGFVSLLSVQTATSRYAFKMAVRNMDVPNISIGSIENHEALGLVRSPASAALVDIIRDNSDVSITYREISSAIRGSSVNDFLADRLKAAADYLLRGKPYSDLRGEDIAGAIKSSSTLVQNLTGRALGPEDYSAIAAYFEEYGNLEDVSRKALDQTPLAKHTDAVRHLMSLGILGAALLICIVLIILTCVVCRESSYIPLGWAFIVSGLAVVLGAVFNRPSYAVSSQFLKTVLGNYFSFFTAAVIIIAGVFTVIGAFIFLIGNASADKE